MKSLKWGIILVLFLTFVFTYIFLPIDLENTKKLHPYVVEAPQIRNVSAKPSKCQKNFEEAQMFLSLIRSGSEFYDGYMWHIQNLMKACDLSYEDIGTDLVELTKLQHLGYLKSAKLALADLRSGDNDYFYHMLHLINRYVSDGSLTLAEIGTTSKELKRLKLAHYRMRTKQVVKELRNDPRNHKLYLKDLEDITAESNLTWRELGVSKKEINKLIRQSHKHKPKHWQKKK